MAPGRTRAGSGPTVLVVDDTPSLLDTVRVILEDSGYHVVTTLRSTDALRLAQVERPHVVLLDTVMPEMSGWEVLAQLDADPALALIPVVITTGYVAEALGRLEEIRGSARRQVGLLPKPFDAEELLEVVESITAVGAA